MIIKNRKNQAKLMQRQKTSAFRNLFIIKAPLLCANCFLPNKPLTQTFLTLQPKWVTEKELSLNNNSTFRGRNSTKFWIIWIIISQMSSAFIHVTNFKITITNLNSKFCIYYLKSCYFLSNGVSNFLEERISTICASSSGMKR